MFPDDITWFVAYKSICFHVLQSVDPEMATEQGDTCESTPPPEWGESPHTRNLVVEKWQTEVRITEDGTIVVERISVEGKEVWKDSFNVPGTIPYYTLRTEHNLPLTLMKFQVPRWINLSQVS